MDSSKKDDYKHIHQTEEAESVLSKDKLVELNSMIERILNTEINYTLPICTNPFKVD